MRTTPHFLAFCALTALSACSGTAGSPLPSSSSGGEPPSNPPPAASPPANAPADEALDASGCPAKDVLHVVRDGSELAVRVIPGGDNTTSPPGEAQASNVSFVASTNATGNTSYEQVLVGLTDLASGASTPTVSSAIDYRVYPPVPPGQSGVSPTQQVSYSGTTLSGSVELTTPAAKAPGDLLCGTFDITGAQAGKPTVRVHGVFRHQYLGSRPGGAR